MTLSLRQDSVNILQLQQNKEQLLDKLREGVAPDIHGFLDNGVIEIEQSQEQQWVSDRIKTISLAQTRDTIRQQ